MTFANLAWEPKKPLTEFNKSFKSLRLRLQIINKGKASATLDATIYDSYVTKLEQAANQGKGSSPACLVYSAYVQWIGLGAVNPMLFKTMDFRCKMHDMHNRHTSISSESKTPTTTTRPWPMTEGGDAMDIYAIDSRGRGRGGGRGGTTWMYWRSGEKSDSGSSGRSGRDSHKEKGDKPTSPKQEGGSGGGSGGGRGRP